MQVAVVVRSTHALQHQQGVVAREEPLVIIIALPKSKMMTVMTGEVVGGSLHYCTWPRRW